MRRHCTSPLEKRWKRAERQGTFASTGVEFRILGPLEALLDGQAADLGGPRQRAVLALLLLRAGQVVSSDALIDAIWADEPPETAANVLQSYISKLRKELGRDTIVTRGRGYAIALGPQALDLQRFERLTTEVDRADPAGAADQLREALAIWRGPALDDFRDELWARGPSGRLEEMRLAAIELRIDADLLLGRHGDVVGELDELVAEHSLRERLHALRMLALYRCGRQADALDAYRLARTTLVDEIGVEPGPELRELERAILRQDPALAAPRAGSPVRSERSILVAPSDDAAILPLVSIAEPLARRPPRELIAVRLLPEGDDPASAQTHLAGLRNELVGRGLEMRVTAYTSETPGEDIARLAAEQDVDLVLLDSPASLLDDGVPDPDLGIVLRDVLADVAVLVAGGSLHRETTRPVVVPFGGADHDWSAVEIAAWIARALGTKLLLVGTSTDRLRCRRDASRLLGRASLVVQAAAGIVAEPVLAGRGSEGILEAAADAALLVIGLSGRWRSEGLGRSRLEVARAAGIPTLLVRRGVRPGGLAPAGSMTRYTWTLGPEM